MQLYEFKKIEIEFEVFILKHIKFRGTHCIVRIPMNELTINTLIAKNSFEINSNFEYSAKTLKKAVNLTIFVHCVMKQ